MKMQFWTISLSLNDFNIKKNCFATSMKIWWWCLWHKVMTTSEQEKKTRTEKQWQRLYLYSFLFELMSLSRHYRVLMMVSASASAAATTAAMSVNVIFKCHVKNRNTSWDFFGFLDRKDTAKSKWSILTESYFKFSWLHVCLVCVHVVHFAYFFPSR